MATYQDLMSEVRSWAGVDAGDEVRLPTDALRSACIEAMEELARSVRAPWTEETVELSATAGSGAVDIPDRVIELYTLWYTGSSGERVTLIGGSKRQIGAVELGELRAVQGDETGEPQAAAVFGGQLLLAPAPAEDMTLYADVRAVPERPAADTATVPVPDDALRAVRALALARVFEFLFEDQRAAAKWAEAERAVAALGVRYARLKSSARGRRHSWRD